MSLASFFADLNEQTTNGTFDVTSNINKMIEFTKKQENFGDPIFTNCLNYFLNGKIELPLLYPLAFSFIQYIKSTEAEDVWSFYLAFMSKFFEDSDESFINQFREFFADKQCSFEFLIDFISKLYTGNEKQTQKWFQIIKDYQKLPLDPISSERMIDIWVPFILTIDDNDYADRIFKESLKPAFAVEIEYFKHGNISNSTSLSRCIPKFISKDLVNSLVSLFKDVSNANNKGKFIQLYTRNLNKNPDQQEIITYKEILTLLYTEDLFELYCEELNKIPKEYLYQIVTAFAYDLKETKFLQAFEIPSDIIKPFISQVGVSFYPIFADLIESKDEIISFSQKSIVKNQRMKVETYESQFQENFGLMYTNPVVFESFINQHDDSQFSFLSIFDIDGQLKWNKEEEKQFMDRILEIYNDSHVFSSFLSTVCQMQTRLNRFFQFNQTYLWESYFDKCISYPLNEIQYHIFSTLKLLVESTPINIDLSDKVKQQCMELIVHVSLVLMSKDDELIHGSLQTAQHILTHIAPQSFVIVPFALAALIYEKQITSEEISILLSLYLLTNYKQNGTVNLRDFYKNQFAANGHLQFQWIDKAKIDFVSKLIEFDENQLAQVISKNIIQVFNDYLEKTSKEKCNIQEEIGFLYSLLITEIKTGNGTISQQTKELGKSIFSIERLKSRTNKEIHITNRMLGMFLSNFDEIYPQYPELYIIITDFLNIIIHSPEMSVAISTSIIEIFADFCLYTNNIKLFEESITTLQNERKDIKSINSIYNRFLTRMNQPLSPENFPENRNAVTVNKKLSLSSYDLSNPKSIEVSTMTQCGETQFNISLDRSCKDDHKHNNSINDIQNSNISETDNDQESYDLENEFSDSSLEFSSKFHELISNIDKTALTNIDSIEQKFVYQSSLLSTDSTYTAPNVEINSEEESKEPLLALSNHELAPFISAISNGIENSNLIKNTDFLDLSVKSFFHSMIRETLKIGILYVKKGQKDQNIILANNWASTEGSDFRSFIRGLGWLIDLSTHRWNSGKLDINLFSNGRYHIYYESERFEVAFHTAPLMPSNPNDSQQIYKKRHIGNDNVHIVWCEDTIEYETSTITSQFNDAHVIIYPICAGLYRVSVKMKDDDNPIGPLHHETIVPTCSLPSLVRWTAIFADRVSRMSANDTKLPCEVMENQISNFGSSSQKD